MGNTYELEYLSTLDASSCQIAEVCKLYTYA